jgi:hypothetical protein
MQNFLRTFRRAELRGDCRSNPLEVINVYRAVAGLNPDEPLPRGVTVNDMIESILDDEQADSLSSGVLRAIAG